MSDFSVPSWSKYVIGKYFEEDLTRLIQTKLGTFRLKLVYVLISIRGRSTPVSTVLRKSVRFFMKKNSILNLANILSEWLKNPGKVTLGSWNQKNFTVMHPPGPLLEACALDARLQNRSPFILDPRMSIPHLLFTENRYKPSPPRFPGSFGWTSVAYDCLMFALNTIDQSQLTLVHLNHLRGHCTQRLNLFSLECLRWGITN